jgi:hypothetical protein
MVRTSSFCRIRRPTASSPGKALRAPLSLIITTGSESSTSSRVKSRPATTGIPIAGR